MLLVCLTVIVLALTAMLGRMSHGHRQVLLRQRSVQADWLAESGLERAVAQWQRDAAYRGERWRVESDQLGGRGAAEVLIEIETPETQPSAIIRATVRYPDGPIGAVQVKKQLSVPIPNEGETP
jgi:hypothetical protein